jgi:hypothetical protein
MWSAITHLEQAEVAFRKIADKRVLEYVNIERHSEANINYVYVLCLLSILYRYLDEFTLSGESLGRAISRYDAAVSHLDECGWPAKWRSAVYATNIHIHPLIGWTRLPKQLASGFKFCEGRRINPHEL